MTETVTIEDEALAKLVAKKQAVARELEAEQQLQAAASQVMPDGRLSCQGDARGLVQLNVRVPVQMKQALLTERARRQVSGAQSHEVSEIVREALSAFLKLDGVRG